MLHWDLTIEMEKENFKDDVFVNGVSQKAPDDKRESLRVISTN